MIRLRDLTLRPGEGEEALLLRAAEALGARREDILTLTLKKKSIDARKKPDVRIICTVDLLLRGEETMWLKRSGGKASPVQDRPYEPPVPAHMPQKRPVVVGFGPAGIFAALLLAEAGLSPIVLERGEDADTRTEKVAAFWSGGPLDPECNVQFGEGGAGTFSDGKLNTGIKDGRIGAVLERLHRAGADESILYDAKPHVGTDILRTVVKNLRREIIAAGGEIRFGCRMDRLVIKDGRICALRLSDGSELPADHVILAPGHSARDTFEMLLQSGVPMEPKPFSMGARIEHLQSMVNEAQYGPALAGSGLLPPADYKLSCHLRDGGSAYTFCMCPGGEVVAAPSEPGTVVTNGMSNFARDRENANSALLVALTPDRFPDPSPLGGMYWQRELEQRAFALGGGDYRAPAQRVGDFLDRRASTRQGGVTPSIRTGVSWCDLHRLLPPVITDTMEGAFSHLGRRLRGFDHPDAVLTGPETRSSSPVRILRDEGCRAPIGGLYPCGEGAGYAGGIMSAAVDGLRCAEAVICGL